MSSSNIWQKSGAFNNTNWMISGDNRKDLIQLHRHVYNIHSEQDGVNFLYDNNGIKLEIDFNGRAIYPVQVTGFSAGEYTCSVYGSGINETATETGAGLTIGGEDTGIFYNADATEQAWFMARKIAESDYETASPIILPDLESISTVNGADLFLIYDSVNSVYMAIRADDLITSLLKLVTDYDSGKQQAILNDSGSLKWVDVKDCDA